MCFFCSEQKILLGCYVVSRYTRLQHGTSAPETVLHFMSTLLTDTCYNQLKDKMIKSLVYTRTYQLSVGVLIHNLVQVVPNVHLREMVVKDEVVHLFEELGCDPWFK